MDQQTYIPLQQPIEGLQNTTEMMDNKYNLKNLMENSSIQVSTPEFIKIVDQNLIIDDDDMLFENFQENDSDNITEEEQSLILSAFQSALTGNQSNQSELSSNSPNRNQISTPNIKIIKGKMYEIEEPFFKDFDDILPPQPPAYDNHIETIPGSLHRPILPIDTLFPTDDMMYQDGSLVMQNGEKYFLTNYTQKSDKNQEFEKSNSKSTSKSQTISPLLANAPDTQSITQSSITNLSQFANTQSSSSFEISQPQNATLTSTNSLQIPNNSQDALYLTHQADLQNSSPYLFIQQETASPYLNNLPNQPQQQSSQLKMSNPESGKPLFDISPPFQPPPFMPPPLMQDEEPSYRKIQAQPFSQSTKTETQPSYRPIQIPSYPEVPLMQETKPPMQQIVPQQKQNEKLPESNNDDGEQSNENESTKKKNTNKRAEAMPC